MVPRRDGAGGTSPSAEPGEFPELYLAVGAGFSMDGRGEHTPGDRTMLQTDSKALGFLPTLLSLV